MPEFQPGDLVLCPRLGKEEFKIISENSATREFRVKSTLTGEEQPIYQAHCHVSTELRMRNMRNRRENKLARAARIGNPTPKKK